MGKYNGDAEEQALSGSQMVTPQKLPAMLTLEGQIEVVWDCGSRICSQRYSAGQ